MTGEVGVLLPARLETRFDRPDGPWRLRLVVVPAEPWFDRHDPRMGADELGLLRDALVASAGRPLDPTPKAAAGFERLAGQVGAGRAAWLLRDVARAGDDGVRTVPSTADRGPDDHAAPAVVRGLPAELEVWAELDSGATVLLHTLHPVGLLPVRPRAGDGVPTFWADHATLVEAGLAADVELAGRAPDGGDLEPEQIVSLSVVGLGDADPTPLLSAHAHAGQSALLPPGTPTNVTPESAHPVPTARDWFRAVTADPAPGDLGRPAGPDVSQALTGTPDRLPPAPGWADDHDGAQADLVTALWPALWGHALQSVWGGTDTLPAASGAWRWWAERVRPDGPLPTLLVGDQPYGLLPVTPLTDLGGPYHGRLQVPDDIGPRVAGVVAHRLAEVAHRADRVAGTVVDADAAQVERVLRRTPTSGGYGYRWAVPANRFGQALGARHQEQAAGLLDPAGIDPTRGEPLLAVGRQRPSTLPLLHPPVPEGAAGWLEEALGLLAAEGDPGVDGLDPRRADHAWRIVLLWLSSAMTRRLPDAGYSGIDLEEVLVDLIGRWLERLPASLTVRLAVLSARLAWRAGGLLDSAAPALLPLDRASRPWAGDGREDPRPVLEWWQAAAGSLRRLASRHYGPGAGGEPDGALGRTLCAVLDAAVHRVDPVVTALASTRLAEAGAAPRRLGLYAWVDRPYRGTAGFTDRGVVLAPSPEQATTAAILRDRFTAHAAAGEQPPGAWDLTLDSAAVRTATGLLDDVRAGLHPTDAVGRLVEASLTSAEQVRLVRQHYPAPVAVPGRHACDGLAAAADLGASGPPGQEGAAFTAATGLGPDQLGPQRWTELLHVGRVLDAVSDVLLAEAVHASVDGAVPRLSAALDAAAGLVVPPTLRAQATPTSGTTVTTRVLVGLRAGTVGAVDSPGDAEPALAAALDALGDPSGEAFAVEVGGHATTLGALGLRPADLVVVDDAAMAAWVGPARPDGVEGPDGTTGAPLTVGPGVTAARHLVDLLRRTRPVTTAAGPNPGPVAELDARADSLRAAALRLADRVDAALAEAGDPPGDVLTEVLRWGVAARAGDGTVDRARLAAAAARLRAAATEPGPVGTDPAAEDPEAGVRSRVAALQRLAGALTTPGSAADPGLPVLLPWAGDAAAGASPVGDPSWLPIVSRVRPAVSAWDSFAPVLAERTGAPEPQWWADPGDDPWRGVEVGPPVARTRVSTIALLPAGLDPAAVVVAELDSWAELVPGTADGDVWTPAKVPATLAVGFNGPAARAPQAILLAVPPADDVPLDVGLARACVVETRLMARVRALPARALGPLGALVPSAWLPAADGWAGIVLDEDATPTRSTVVGTHVRLEPAEPEGDLARGLQAETADPLWLLSRQWQVGEHQGEDVSSPVRVELSLRDTPLGAPLDRPFADPARWPGEAVLEAAGEDQPGAVPGADPGTDPYDTSRLRHRVTLPLGGGVLRAPAHDGGAADWWSVDADGRALDGPVRSRVVTPGQLRYPGAPAPGWFTLERPDETVTGHVPDAAHVPSLFVLDLLGAHSPDWYLVGLDAAPGTVVTVEDLVVVDTFGEAFRFDEQRWETLERDRWAAFRTTGLGARDLLAWAATPAPLEGPVLEQVVLGVDEDANLLWVVEQVVDGRTVPTRPEPHAVDPVDPLVPAPLVFRTVGPAPARRHPYPATDDTAPDAPRRVFRQGRLLSLEPHGERPADPVHPTTRLLRPIGAVHEVDPLAVTAGGTTLERRWVLARAADGGPVTWQQRRHRPTVAAPTYDTGFDRTSPGRPPGPDEAGPPTAS